MIVERYESKPIVIENRRWDPITGGASSALGWGSDMAVATADLFVRPYQEYRRSRPEESHPTSSSSVPSSLTTVPRTETGEAFEQHRSNDGVEESSERKLESRSDAAADSTVAPGKGDGQLQSSRHHSISSTRSDLLETSAQSPGHHHSPDKKKGRAAAASSAVAASGKSVGRWFGTYTKGIFLDVPLAVAEGMRQTPALYGERVHDYGRITGWKSGAAFAAKNFGVGLAEG